MYQRRLFRLLLLPSLLSGCSATLLSSLYLAYAGWRYIQDNLYFYDYLFGASGTQTYLWEHPFTAPLWLSRIFTGSPAYFVLIATAAIIIGIIVYGTLQTISNMRTQKTDLTRELAIAGTRREDMVVELVTHLALRAVALLGWGLYMLFFTGTLLAATTLILHIGIDNIQAGHTPLGLVQLGGDTLLLIATTHMHVYFLRLVLLRPRVFHGDNSVEAVADSSH